jgi:hypothetical protein
MQHAYWDDLLGLEFPGFYLTDESAARMHAEIEYASRDVVGFGVVGGVHHVVGSSA